MAHYTCSLISNVSVSDVCVSDYFVFNVLLYITIKFAASAHEEKGRVN